MGMLSFGCKREREDYLAKRRAQRERKTKISNCNALMVAGKAPTSKWQSDGSEKADSGGGFRLRRLNRHPPAAAESMHMNIITVPTIMAAAPDTFCSKLSTGTSERESFIAMDNL
jgi:hypothetical protein